MRERKASAQAAYPAPSSPLPLPLTPTSQSTPEVSPAPVAAASSEEPVVASVDKPDEEMFQRPAQRPGRCYMDGCNKKVSKWRGELQVVNNMTGWSDMIWDLTDIDCRDHSSPYCSCQEHVLQENLLCHIPPPPPPSVGDKAEKEAVPWQQCTRSAQAKSLFSNLWFRLTCLANSSQRELSTHGPPPSGYHTIFLHHWMEIQKQQQNNKA